MFASFVDRILGLHGWVAAVVVFGLPALESSAFIGFVFPGEIAVLLGGVLAYQHKLSLGTALVAAIAGAVIGDTIGYEIGKRYGRRLLHGTVGRVVRHEHLDRAEAYLARRGGRAVFFGRFTAALRVLIPGLAGMSGLRYRTFLLYNAAGGALWATGFVLAGFLAGSSWRRVEHIAGRASLVLLLIVILAVSLAAAGRWIAANQQRLHDFADRQLARPRAVRLRNRFDRQLGFLRRRVEPDAARGLSLTAGLMILVLTGWAFGAVVQDVAARDEVVALDRPTLNWFVAHREPWLTTILEAVTALGSTGIVIPLAIVVGVALARRRRSLRPVIYLVTTYAGAEALFQLVKKLTDRPRPPAQLAVVHAHGLAFPSGHTTLATAMYGAIAISLGTTHTWRRLVLLSTIAATIAVAVGLTRIYLGVHWLTDVLGGWALGAAWLAITTTSIVRRPGIELRTDDARTRQ